MMYSELSMDDLSTNLALAGLGISSPMPAGVVMVPSTIELVANDEAIHWVVDDAPSSTLMQPPADLVHLFWKLFDARPEKIVIFAHKYGVLGLTEDARFPQVPNMIAGLEPLDTWRGLASQVRSILNLAALIHRGEDITPDDIIGEPAPICERGHSAIRMRFSGSDYFCSDEARVMRQGLFCVCPICYHVEPNTRFGSIGRWAADALQTLPNDTLAQINQPTPSGYFWNGKPFPEKKERRLRVAQTCLDWTIEDWLFRFPSTLGMERSDSALDVVLGYRFGLLSAITLQLLQVIARKEVFICSECKNPSITHTERKPRRDRDVFCDTCRGPSNGDASAGRRNIAANRRADQRRRENVSRARQLWEKGISAAQIAEKLQVRSPETINRWATKGKWNV
jgi:hypothetical protein